ncbi:glycoside hydrolase family 73 protein [Bombilactobacillus folatiphilus]|uniref:Glycoside hydrolase family 73 protein n=1 Tax=Bombilactobacillus folatiphilus TaxID=2923362 RepID=A0ABY4P7S2_9LACO|nr:glycoside hydrolase family 73 protein [Bombilactobacillus folatiphilus]UQS81641.1 glycoside hydrolase family 73 protein [Bombilactobacillus folatiphilus]
MLRKNLKQSASLFVSATILVLSLKVFHLDSQLVNANSLEPITINVNDAENLDNTIVSNGYGDQIFLNFLGLSAQKLASNNDLYASVMLAQALLESGWGTSSLSQIPNYNLFGVKGSFKGDAVNMATQEDDGSGNLYGIQSNFRKYPSYKESLEDYVRLLRENNYAGTWRSKTSSYKDATAFLTGRYATDTSYADKLNSLIEKYDLTRFDQSPSQNPNANDIVVDKVSFLTNSVSQQENIDSTKNTYQDQQAPVIVRNKFHNPANDVPLSYGNVTVPVVVSTNAVSQLINQTNEITQGAPKKVVKPNSWSSVTVNSNNTQNAGHATHSGVDSTGGPQKSSSDLPTSKNANVIGQSNEKNSQD